MFGKKKEREMPLKPANESTSTPVNRDVSVDLSATAARPVTRSEPNAASMTNRPTTSSTRPNPTSPQDQLASISVRRNEARNNTDSEGKRLIVGRDIVLTGEIRACQRLVVEGRVEASLTDSRSIEISEFGVFKGSAHIETADISGRFEGDITVHGRLTVRSTGKVVGSIRYAQLEVEKGGALSGQVELLSDLHDNPHQGYETQSAGQASLQPTYQIDESSQS
ncbi:MAG: polymer-forming cytoskeletal protein [Alphaproteobacteria bacterium]|nr:polymer-forming cytoskeletal protein [Alphaproteobacteria bacterium]